MHVIAREGPGSPTAAHRVLLVADERLTDYRDLSGGGSYADESYWWLSDGGLELRLDVEPGKDHVLELLWGSKGDMRGATLTAGDHTQEVAHGSYDGFEWIKISIPAEHFT